jgi:oligopeptide/dipeptide ABC transporter ATP-binding protein
MSLMLEVSELRISLVEKGVIKREIVKGVSLKVEPGRIVCLVGESGSGKSLTGYSIMNLMPSDNLKVTNGNIFFHGRDILSLSGDDLRKLRGSEIFLIPQDPLTSLNPVLTVEKQIAEMYQYHTGGRSAEIKKRCRELLEMVNIDNADARLKAYPHQLSGGQRQRVLIAMAMALNPSLIIADEPTTALDVSVQWGVLELFIKLKTEKGVGFLFITHDFGVVKAVADFIYVMYGGKILEEGTREEIFSDPRHPYTQGLIKAVPSIDSVPQTPLAAIAGYALESSYTCPFYERCDKASEDCREDFQYKYLSDSHGVLCRKES